VFCVPFFRPIRFGRRGAPADATRLVARAEHLASPHPLRRVKVVVQEARGERARRPVWRRAGMDQRREAALAASRNPEPVSAPGKPACRRPSPPSPHSRRQLGLAGAFERDLIRGQVQAYHDLQAKAWGPQRRQDPLSRDVPIDSLDRFYVEYGTIFVYPAEKGRTPGRSCDD
jgi:hypothetical protein